jgi:glutamine amidotransferase
MIAIIDYDAGNLASVERAISYLGFKCIVTNNIKTIAGSERIIFPGVGAAGAAMNSLKRLGLDLVIKQAVIDGKPILGICLGTQIIMEYSEENETPCLKIIDGFVKAFPPDIKSKDGSRLKIPHMGWNGLENIKKHPVLSNLHEDDEFYFVHGYYPNPNHSEHILGTTDYGISFASVIGFNNIIATQFHPEKSGRPGLSLLKNFCMWNPS